ncbi:DUF4834 family protein [Microvirga sp. STR05]|uniref:DUF4834 family protein n=1 Tax=Hymenobacter duratus TaxID=2771356 RepID=A0ABR8JGB2_9BACT|nr:DUF4834 family protein [Hymenobacter duratus]MBD2713834.1 DUF4834 family protein [Hymenobacter duratus]MBR7948736.1 DUF4834 family protein [Microvirga sp. STR05]
MLIKFLLIFFLLALVLRFVLPVLMRYLVVGFLQKQARRHAQQFGGAPFEAAPNASEQTRTASGDVHVDYVPPRPKPAQPKEFKGGEYVDFEEVK